MKIGRSKEFVVVKKDKGFPKGFFPVGTQIKFAEDNVYINPPPPLDSMVVKYGQVIYKHLRYVVYANEIEMEG